MSLINGQVHWHRDGSIKTPCGRMVIRVPADVDANYVTCQPCHKAALEAVGKPRDGEGDRG